ncbi:MAG: SRPBCC family protein [Microthrixaceae bacterium]
MSTNQAAARQGSGVAGASRSLDASPTEVWQALLDVSEWSEWYRSIKDLEAPAGRAEVGTEFSFRTGPATIKAEVEEAQPAESFRFTGRSAGSITTYAFKIESDGSGSSVMAAQSLGGLATRAIKPVLQGVAEKSVVSWLDALAVHLGE